MTEEAKKELKDEVKTLAAALTKGITVKADGTTDVQKDLYTANLPEGLTEDTVKAVSTYNSTFVAAGAKAVGTLAVEAMAKHKAVDSVSASLSMTGRDHVDYTVHRQKEYPNPAGGDKIVKKGVVDASLHVQGGVTKAGQLKIAREQIAELAIKSLK